MWRLTWRLVTVGIPFKFQSEVPIEELSKRVRQRSVWHALRAEQPSKKVAFRLNGTHLSAFVVKVNLWMFARPVFYADVQNHQVEYNNFRTLLLSKARADHYMVDSVICAGIRGNMDLSLHKPHSRGRSLGHTSWLYRNASPEYRRSSADDWLVNSLHQTQCAGYEPTNRRIEGDRYSINSR